MRRRTFFIHYSATPAALGTDGRDLTRTKEYTYTPCTGNDSSIHQAAEAIHCLRCSQHVRLVPSGSRPCRGAHWGAPWGARRLTVQQLPVHKLWRPAVPQSKLVRGSMRQLLRLRLRRLEQQRRVRGKTLCSADDEERSRSFKTYFRLLCVTSKIDEKSYSPAKLKRDSCEF
ncbi:uncharacterized protein LOC142777225 [Rhipicephalus microplus]|uniref:uncharacterized protein LOC142777225 n=1 Tax=Rhipicephalus microplus TaxID=6941 RepID=UPI003F6D0263